MSADAFKNIPNAGPASGADAVRQRADLIHELMRLPWLDATQAAIVAGCNPVTIRRGCLSGRLKHVRLNSGKLFRIRPSALATWLGGAD